MSRRRRLKSLKDENWRLKKLLADAMLDDAALKDLLEKNAQQLRRDEWPPHSTSSSIA